MKPTLPITATNRHSLTSTNVGSLKTDYQFQPNSMAEFAGRCHGDREDSFRRISQEYFKHEAPGHFISEAAIFGLIAFTALVAMVQGVHAGLSAFGLL